MARKVKRPNVAQASLELPAICTALYIRVSTEKQADEGFSLEAQETQLRAFCVAQGWHVCESHIYVDAGISGKTSDRPAFQRMMQAAQAGEIGRVVAIKLDRLARNTRDFLATVEQLKAWGCELALIKEAFDTSTPHGKFALTMFAAIAELEASTITERVMTGKRQKATDGGYNGSRIPLGYDYDGETWSINEHADTVRNIFAMFLDGQTLKGIADQLNAAGIPTMTGAQWSHPTVKYILRNGFYAGLAQWDGLEVPGQHAAVIDRATYEAAHTMLANLRPGRRWQ